MAPSHYLNQWWPQISTSWEVIIKTWQVDCHKCWINKGDNHINDKQQHLDDLTHWPLENSALIQTLWQINILRISCETAPSKFQSSAFKMSTFILVMAWCHQAPSHCMNQCQPNLQHHMLPPGIKELTATPYLLHQVIRDTSVSQSWRTVPSITKHERTNKSSRCYYGFNPSIQEITSDTINEFLTSLEYRKNYDWFDEFLNVEWVDRNQDATCKKTSLQQLWILLIYHPARSQHRGLGMV